MGPTITSMDLIEKAHRLGFIMDLAADIDDEAELAKLDDEATELLETLAAETPDKLDALRAVFLRIEAETKLIRQEEKTLAAKRRAREGALDRIRSLTLGILQGRRESGLDPKVRTETNTFWLQTSAALVGPEDPALWPHRWQRVKVEPDRKAASEALKAGEAVDGFRLDEREGVRWR